MSLKRMENKALESWVLKVLVEKEKNKIIFVEANKEFIDVLFSFPTLPIGTIIKLTGEHSLRGEIGCLNELYGSVENLDKEFLKSEKKGILLHPRSAAEIYYRSLKLNFSDTESMDYYVCLGGNHMSCYFCANCHCGRELAFKLVVSNPDSKPAGFVQPTARFIVTDEFQVLKLSTTTALAMLSKVGSNGSTVEERVVTIGRDEVLNLLKCSLTSSTPFSDTLLQPLLDRANRVLLVNYGLRNQLDPSKKGTDIRFKLFVNRLSNLTLYAEVREDFVDLLCSFLTLPIGYVFEKFPSLSFEGCMGNLYKSIQDTEIDLFSSAELKECLISLRLAPGLAYRNQLLGIEEASTPFPSPYFMTADLHRLDSKSRAGNGKIGEGFVKGPSMFMVMDNLKIMPLSAFSALSFMEGMHVPLSKIQELELTMGENEALHLLATSLVSKHALTDTFLLKDPISRVPKQEP